MLRWLKRGAVAVAVILLSFIGFETFAVLRAKVRTPAILAAHARPVTALDELGRRRLAILLRVEDPGFFRHRGVDYDTPGQGATTLTQALVKRLYFDGGFGPALPRSSRA